MVYVATDLGVFRSPDGGATWISPTDPIKASTEITAFAFDPSKPSTAYAGSAYSGVLKSEDRGETWRIIDGTGDRPQAVSALTLDPASPANLYAGSYAGVLGALYKSSDGGNTWRGQFLSGKGSTIRSIAIDPSSSDRLYVGTDYFAFKSIHDGLWQMLGVEQSVPTGQPVNVMALALDPRTPETVYAATACTVGFEGTPCGDGVYRSQDAGESWTALHGGMRPYTATWSLALLPDAGILYAGTYYGVFQLPAGGRSWRPVDEGLENPDIIALAYSNSSDSLFAASWNQLFKLGGASREAPDRNPRPSQFRW